MFAMISEKGVKLDETDEPLIQFERSLVEKPGFDYDFERDMTVVAWTMTMARTLISLTDWLILRLTMAMARLLALTSTVC